MEGRGRTQPSAEGYRIVWVWNSLMSLEDAEARRARIEKACAGLDRLQNKLQGPRCRFRLRGKVEEAAAQILLACDANRWILAEITERAEPVYRQAQRGRPCEATRYLRRQRMRFSVAARVKTEVVIADERSDGMFPLITNCRSMSAPDVLAAYKIQPKLEKRHEQLKTVQDLSPVWLKNVDRIEALLFLYFVALLVHALLERELRRGMAKAKIPSLPLYPEERDCRAPATERILDLFNPSSAIALPATASSSKPSNPSSPTSNPKSSASSASLSPPFKSLPETVARYRISNVRKVRLMESYRDLREHGNACAIVVMELLLGLVLLPHFRNWHSCWNSQDAMSFVGVLLFWTLPGALSLYVAAKLEIDFI